MDCSICCERFNKVNHKKVLCSFCDFEACRSCVQQYLLGSTNDPHCMNCKNAWNREFVDQSCTKIFRNKELKNHRENILFEREKCLMPETQEYVVREKQIREMTKQAEEARLASDRYKRIAIDLEEEVRMMRQYGAPQQLEKKEFVRKCPVENCKGFLSTRWKCELCDNHICSECNEIKSENHECDPGNVETVKLLKKDTKPCPKCGTLHFKISGCSQMWCPDCHTAYNWNTGRIEAGIIHNPHYYEFQRTNGAARGRGRNLGDIPCGGIPTIYELNQIFGYNSRYYNTDRKSRHQEYYDIHRLILHTQDYELRWNFRIREVNNRDLRVEYLLNNISDENFKRTIQKREKANDKKRDIANILQMFVDTGGDLMRQMVQDPTEENRLEILNLIKNLRDYVNKSFLTISKRYTSKNFRITDKWEFV